MSVARRRCGPSTGDGDRPESDTHGVHRAGADVVLTPLLAVGIIGPDKSARTLRSVETWLLTNLNTITVVILVILATVLIGRGLDLFR